MPDKDVNIEQDASPVQAQEQQDVKDESSPSDLEGATSSKADQQAVEAEQTVPYDRFREVNEERKYYQKILEQMVSRQQQGETSKQVEEDPYSGMTPEELKFYREMDTRTQKLIQKEAQKLAEPLVQQVNMLSNRVVKIMEKEFRSTNVDVQPDSAEERQIAKLINSGVDPEQAAWAVMGPKRVEAAKADKAKKQQTIVQQKAKANVEVSSIPSDTAIPQGKTLSFREKLELRAKESGFAL